tara:strand:- start:1245 stop:1568 length:324 start_codon:yes stop_codon:yes gene_type:complete
MDNISIQIPAALFCALYERFGQHTENQIVSCLQDLAGSTASLTSSSSLRPKLGTITGRVWEIADRIKANDGNAQRNAVVQASIEEGINMNTANTQYSHWAKENQRTS